MRSLLALLSLLAMGCSGPGGAMQCTSLDGHGGNFCVPAGGLAPAGQALTLELISPGNQGCTTVESTCVVTLDGGTLELTLAGTKCDPIGLRACTDELRRERLPCAVLPLPEGDFVVTSPGRSSVLLQVRDAGATSCEADPFG